MRAIAARILVFMPIFFASAPASAGWTFCVAEAAGGKEIWITPVFAAPKDRVRLEADFTAYLKGRGVEHANTQCPQPKDDKTDMVNAQFTATEFHRKLGDTMHEVVTPEFDPKR